ncbi:MAG TPA: hypothetical protein VNP96_08385 [Solirubrobacterales bacterium]|nr:hypothetical protein [Solirubrobacterales bacterium]
MTVVYRVGPGEGDTVIEVEPHVNSEDPPGAYVTVTDDQNPSMAIRLGLDEIAELREILGKVEEVLRSPPARR